MVFIQVVRSKRLSNFAIFSALAFLLLFSVVSANYSINPISPSTYLFGDNPLNEAEATTSEMQCFTPGCEAHVKVSEELGNSRWIDRNVLYKMDYTYHLEGDLKFDASRNVFFPEGDWEASCDYTIYYSELGSYDIFTQSWSNPVNFQLQSHGQISSGLYPSTDDLGAQGAIVSGDFWYTYESGMPVGITGSAKIWMHFDPLGLTSGPCMASIATWESSSVTYAPLTKDDDDTLTASTTFHNTLPNYNPAGKSALDDPDYTSATISRSGSFIAFPDNQPPIASAGPDLPTAGVTIEEGDTITLTGSGSDPDNDPLTYQWGQISGEPDVSLDNANTDTATFTAPDVDSETELVFKLVVSDDKGASDEDTAVVTIGNDGDFSIICKDFAEVLSPGGTAETDCTIQSEDGFDDDVDMTCDVSSESKIHCGFDPDTVSPPTDSSIGSTLLVGANADTPDGTYELEITGTSGELSHTITIPITVVSDELDIVFAAFIPADYLDSPGPHPNSYCKVPIPGSNKPLTHQLVLDGDGRGFDPESDSFRARQSVTVVTNENDLDGMKDGTIAQNEVGESKSYAPPATNDGKIDSSDDDAVLDDCYLLHKQGKASTDDMFVTVNKVSNDEIIVRLLGSSQIPILKPSPAIDWDFTLTLVKEEGGGIKWTLKGAHDGFPAYEIYINKQPLYTYDPGPQPYTSKQTDKLFGKEDTKVNLTGLLSSGLRW